MLTYTEYCLQKQAGEDDQPPNIYADYKAKAEAGDANAQKILDTPVSTEYGWGLLGAGLGAGGGYLLSKRLRRNATKRQRALDVILGALAGGGLTLLAGNNITDNTGLTLFQKKRLDALNTGDNYSNGEVRQEVGEDVNPRDVVKGSTKALSIAGGALLGQHVGAKILPADTLLMRRDLMKLAPAKAKASAAEFRKWRSTDAAQKLIARDPALSFKKGLGGLINRGIGGTAGGYGGALFGDWAGNRLADWTLGPERQHRAG